MKKIAAMLATIALIAVGVEATATASLGAARSRVSPGVSSAASTIAWGHCANQFLRDQGARCAMLDVPLDYADPSGPQIQIALSRIVHQVPDSEYQGVMLVNPGGPGGSGLIYSVLGKFIPDPAGDPYDWIGFDPRGVGASQPSLSCIPKYFHGDRPPYVPRTDELETKWLERSQRYADACEANAPDLLAHMTTIDAARDMDSIRQALGVPQINYFGFSYGTYLGQVYTTLFPGSIRRAVFDSTVDPRRVFYQSNLDQDLGFDRNVRIWFEWLATYKGNNVAVFDFYNVLTGPDSHHRFHGGKIEHTAQPGRNSLHYPTNGDDHPSAAGGRKATAEFVPLLNVYYHRWHASPRAVAAPEPPPRATPSPQQAARAAQEALPAPEAKQAAPPLAAKPEPPMERPAAPPPVKAEGVIDDFDQEPREWAAFLDEGKKTRLSFQRDQTQRQQGTASLCISYDVAPQSWATCALVYQRPRDWRTARGLSLYVRASRAGQPVVVVAHQGQAPERLSSFQFRTETTQAAVGGWQKVEIPWERFVQPPWEGDGKAKFDPGSAMGVSLAFEGAEGERRKGELWVDAISLLPR